MRWLLALLLLLPLWLADPVQACQSYSAPVLHKTTPASGTIVIDGVTVTVLVAGTSTLATIYSDSGCASTKSNPMTSDADGLFSFWANDGNYDIVFEKPDYTFPSSTTPVQLYEPLGEHVALNAKFAASDPCTAVIGAIDQIAATVRELVINKPVLCGTTKTSPSNVTWTFTGSGSITTNSPQTLTINGPVNCPHGRTCFAGTGTYVFGAGAGPYPYGQVGVVNPTYGANVAITCSLGKTFIVTVTDNAAFNVNNATKCGIGARILIRIKNTSGGALGTLTFGSASFYKTGAAWTQPATGFHRDIEFEYDGVNMQEVSRSAADVTN